MLGVLSPAHVPESDSEIAMNDINPVPLALARTKESVGGKKALVGKIPVRNGGPNGELRLLCSPTKEKKPRRN